MRPNSGAKICPGVPQIWNGADSGPPANDSGGERRVRWRPLLTERLVTGRLGLYLVAALWAEAVGEQQVAVCGDIVRHLLPVVLAGPDPLTVHADGQ